MTLEVMMKIHIQFWMPQLIEISRRRYRTLASEDARHALVEAIERLPERQRLVLTLYYFEELTMKEIGVVLHVTESRICQLHAQAMIRLKALLGPIRPVKMLLLIPLLSNFTVCQTPYVYPAITNIFTGLIGYVKEP